MLFMGYLCMFMYLVVFHILFVCFELIVCKVTVAMKMLRMLSFTGKNIDLKCHYLSDAKSDRYNETVLDSKS